MLERCLPAMGWLRSYKREDLPGDLIASAIVTIALIPPSGYFGIYQRCSACRSFLGARRPWRYAARCGVVNAAPQSDAARPPRNLNAGAI